MKTLLIQCPNWAQTEETEWKIRYTVRGTSPFRVINIGRGDHRLRVTIGENRGDYYISCPTYHCALFAAQTSLTDQFCICAHLLASDVPMVDAISITQVLAEIARVKEVK